MHTRHALPSLVEEADTSSNQPHAGGRIPGSVAPPLTELTLCPDSHEGSHNSIRRIFREHAEELEAKEHRRNVLRGSQTNSWMLLMVSRIPSTAASPPVRKTMGYKLVEDEKKELIPQCPLPPPAHTFRITERSSRFR